MLSVRSALAANGDIATESRATVVWYANADVDNSTEGYEDGISAAVCFPYANLSKRGRGDGGGSGSGGGGGGAQMTLSGELRIALYSVIFLLSVTGNALVIATLAQNRRMRTLTNVLLLNLSVSDLLLALFCMPFTLIPTLLKNFIFGTVMCVLIRYMQGNLLD